MVTYKLLNVKKLMRLIRDRFHLLEEILDVLVVLLGGLGVVDFAVGVMKIVEVVGFGRFGRSLE